MTKKNEVNYKVIDGRRIARRKRDGKPRKEC